ncbi:MauE/DoxX family redox-associated membrane protein [Rhodopseudomonas sp. B29]|uniref:MauE/DoxX family redox-associated membrane protein n=1 Tax=Rhodopseudomonas sp. B29 TaxID=95607 RepID=UPI000349E45D|nr:MauE/DoxX family redox-associated membrane protein [Rhodopseudomonas sp. B29]
MSWHLDPLLYLVATGWIVVVLARAAVEKLSGYGLYVANLGDYRLLPDAAVPLIAPVLLAAEIAAICCLLLPWTRAAGAVTACVLFGLYALAMVGALRAGRTEIECGCGGDGQPVSWGLVVRNAVLVLTGAALLLPQSPRSLGWADMTVGALAIAVLFLLLVIAEKMIGTAAAIRRLDSNSHS